VAPLGDIERRVWPQWRQSGQKGASSWPLHNCTQVHKWRSAAKQQSSRAAEQQSSRAAVQQCSSAAERRLSSGDVQQSEGRQHDTDAGV